MDLLHFIFAFNVGTCLIVLLGCYRLHRSYDDRTDGKEYAPVNLAGISGAMLSVVLMSGVARMFV
jgi:hypothetical protein